MHQPERCGVESEPHLIGVEPSPGTPVGDIQVIRIDDALVNAGFPAVTVLDLSKKALATAKTRLGSLERKCDGSWRT